MKKDVLKTFAFTKSFLQFLQIIILFLMLMYILYWIEHLIEANWWFLNIFRPILNLFVSIGRHFSEKEVYWFTAKFEYHYGIAFVLHIVSYYMVGLMIYITNICKNIYIESEAKLRKMEESKLNKELEKEHKNRETAIKKYKIYISTSVKQQNPHFKTVFDIDKYNSETNKFLIKQTSSIPTEYENGYLYSFSNFENIDKILDVFSKLFETDAPVNHVVCVQIYGQNVYENASQLRELIKLNFANKIYTMADTVWRYKFNRVHTYSLSMLGSYQEQENTFDVYQFVKNETM